MATYTIEVRAADGDTVRAQLDRAPLGLLHDLTPQEVRDSLRELLRPRVTTDLGEIKRFFDLPTSPPSTMTVKVA